MSVKALHNLYFYYFREVIIMTMNFMLNNNIGIELNANCNLYIKRFSIVFI